MVLIDDDEVIRAVWELAAEESGKIINTYKNPNDFISDMHHYNKNTTIYINSELKSDLPGEVYGKFIWRVDIRQRNLVKCLGLNQL